MTEVREDLERVVELMVDRPEEVAIEEVPGARGSTLELRMAPDDLGKVIGRQGRTARALRSLLAAREARGGGRHALEILDD